ncbi:MAG: NAD(P)-binding protein [Pseudomonadota bacterium]|nr:NAD(P)-binding protein [Pseudomonadota bacterium]
MNQDYKKLGMNTDISRRDFINGIGIAIGSSLMSESSASGNLSPQDLPGYYPPKLTGMRGSHPGSFEAAHLVRDGASFNAVDSNESYDLVVVGAGISGLSAAYFYRENVNKNGKILILDNHDDFGGHAKRNEFTFNGKKIIGFGGTMLLEEPNGYPDVAKKLLHDLGVDVQRFSEYLNGELYSSYNLNRGLFFDKESFGKDHLAVGNKINKEMLDGAPLSKKAKQDLIRLYSGNQHYLPNIPTNQYYSFLDGMSYQDYLKDYAKMHDDVIKVMQAATRGVWAINIDAFPAAAAWVYDYPGFGDLSPSFHVDESEEPNIFHFPDGNATIARLLVRNMIPKAAPGNTMEDIVTSRFNYSELDQSDSKIKIRLSSTVVRALHINNSLSNDVKISYFRDGKIHAVKTKRCIMACYNAIIPRLCPEMPKSQKQGLMNCVRAPLVYTNVLIRNWQSFVKLGISRVNMPGFLHHNIRLDFPVSMGDYHFSKNPDEPILLHLQSVPGDHGNPSPRQQFIEGQRKLLSTSFEEFERSIRDQLNRLLSPAGFDVAKDILGITVNRWPHGYAYGYDPGSDQIAFDVDSWPEEKQHWVKGRKPFGNIRIASSDSASDAMTESAILQAKRAVNEFT